jgi:predicted nucleic acid-binding protein
VILDTNFLIDLFDGDAAAHAKAQELHDRQVIQRIPAPVLAELEYGAAYELNEQERRRIRNVSRMYSVTRLDQTLAMRAGQLMARADRDADGATGADLVDAMVAAVAEVSDEPVLTDDRRDFEDLGVRTESF